MNKGLVFFLSLIAIIPSIVNAEAYLWADRENNLDDKTLTKPSRKSYIKQADSEQIKVKIKNELVRWDRHNNSIYLGGGMARSRYRADIGKSNFVTGSKGYLGFRKNENIAVELSYVDFGDYDEKVLTSTVTISSYSIAASVVGLLPVTEHIDLYAKGGIHRWGGSISVDQLSDSDHGFDPFWGAGVQLGYDRFSVRAEYEKYYRDTDLALSVGDTDSDLLSFNGQIHF